MTAQPPHATAPKAAAPHAPAPLPGSSGTSHLLLPRFALAHHAHQRGRKVGLAVVRPGQQHRLIAHAHHRAAVRAANPGSGPEQAHSPPGAWGYSHHGRRQRQGLPVCAVLNERQHLRLHCRRPLYEHPGAHDGEHEVLQNKRSDDTPLNVRHTGVVWVPARRGRGRGRGRLCRGRRHCARRHIIRRKVRRLHGRDAASEGDLLHHRPWAVRAVQTHEHVELPAHQRRGGFVVLDGDGDRGGEGGAVRFELVRAAHATHPQLP
mmetsp:Transcript_28966/g.72467  ORF Transcript_28966/g.72467 Transcript_28966/m.72467 type:complete len:263 (-) Transcript_28966:841-1629(-)